MHARALSASIFRFFYSSAYSILFLVLLVALAVTPADHIYQTIKNHKLGNVFVVGGTLLVTFLLSLFIYASRLFTNRVTLAAIPRPYLPVEKGEVPNKVHRIVVQNRQRSAIIAWDSRPRDLRPEQDDEDSNGEPDGLRRRLRQRTSKQKVNSQQTMIPISSDRPPWGKIEHPGWSAPSSEDMPDLHFEDVVTELPNLIEAKAVSLVPPDPSRVFDGAMSGATLPPDPRVVALLQRPANMGLRDYVTILDRFDLIDPPELAEQFLAEYEHARFSGAAVTESEFRSLMHVFSSILVGMAHVNVAALEEALSDQEASESSSMSSRSTLSSLRDKRLVRPAASQSESSLQSFQSVLHHTPPSSIPGDPWQDAT